MEAMSVSPPRSANDRYLPSFLMGDLASPNPPSHTTPLRPTEYSRSTKCTVEGPPIVGLFDDVSSSSPCPSHMSPNSSILDVSCNQENIDKNNCWVVVFGFPPACVTQVLAMFSQLGKVVEHSYQSNSNWLFIKYASQPDTRKALSMNEKILPGNVMIAVTERKQHHSPRETGNLSAVSPNQSMASSLAGTPTSPKIRPLALSKRGNPPSTSSTPVATQDTSLVGKVMDFIFSW